MKRKKPTHLSELINGKQNSNFNFLFLKIKYDKSTPNK